MKPHGKRTELLSKQRLLFFLGVNMSNKEICKYYVYPTYATCSSCNIDGKYTSCCGNKDKCKFRPVYKKSEQKMNRGKK